MPVFQVFKLAGTGDLLIESGSFQLADDATALQTMTQQNLNMVKGDWFLDLLSGMDYFEAIFAKKQIDLEMTTEFKEAILDTPGVTALKNFELEFSGRDLVLNFTAITIFSQPDGEGDIVVNERLNPIQ